MGVGGHLTRKADCERVMHDGQECRAKKKKKKKKKNPQGQQAGEGIGGGGCRQA